jgi:subtilisin family serine protease
VTGFRSIAALAVGLILMAMRLGAESQKSRYVEGEVLVSFSQSASLETSKMILGNHALGLAKHYELLSEHLHQPVGLIKAKNKTTAELIAELKEEPQVETVEPNYLRWTSVASVPNDPLFQKQWSLQNTAQSVQGTSGATGADTHFAVAWALTRPATTNPPVVAVIDTGLYYTHPDLASNLWVNASELPGNHVDDDHDGYVDDVVGYNFADGNADVTDSGSHGTHVSGTIAAVGNNGIGVIGVAWQAKIMALKVSNDGTTFSTSGLVDAIQYATMMKKRGVNVVAMNGSYGGPDNSTLEKAAIKAAGDAGIIFCAAAGNDASNNDSTPTYPAGYQLTNIIVVGASDQQDGLASFSNYGATNVDLAASGVNILSTTPPGLTSFVTHGALQYSAEALTFSGMTTGLTAKLFDCKLGYPADFPVEVRSNIALIKRGTLKFSEKVANAVAAHAFGAIIYNNVSGLFSGTLQYQSNWIPAVSISQDDGNSLLAAVGDTVTIYSAQDPQAIYGYKDGTSMAAPHVAGAVALAALNFPEESMGQRMQRILRNVDILPGLQQKVRTGGRLNLQRAVDADANGLPDWWELTFFNHQTGTDPNADTDHDGATNFQEFLADTNPADTTSSLRIIGVSRVPAGTYVSWSGGQVSRQILQRAPSPSGPWTDVFTNLAPTSFSGTYLDTSTNVADFYRLRVERP